MQVSFEVQPSLKSSTMTSHLLSKAQCMSADDRHVLDLTDRAFLLVGAVKSCSLTLSPPSPKGSPVIGYIVCGLRSAQQQDVSEFTHKLLDWLEDAFQMKAEEDR